MITIHTCSVGQLEANCYLVADPKSTKTVIIDPGDESEYLADQIQKYGLSPVRIVATHGHFDHIMAAYALSVNFKIPFSMHPDDAFLVHRMEETAKHFLETKHVDPPPHIDSYLYPGDQISFGSERLEVIGVPGHTPGSVALVHKESKALFVGDTVFAQGALGRTDHTYSDPKAFHKTVQTILGFPQDWTIYPGHGEAVRVALAKRAIGV